MMAGDHPEFIYNEWPEAVFETMQQLTPPLLMASLTTAGGIGSLAVSSMRSLQARDVRSMSNVCREASIG